MKKWIIILMLWSSATIAGGGGKLLINITNATKNSYYLCINNTDCVGINYAKNLTLPLHVHGQIDSISIIDSSNHRFYPQTVPSSCRISVQPSDYLTVSGKLGYAKDHIKINNLKCIQRK